MYDTWRGWLELGPEPPMTEAGPWADVSQPYHDDMARIDFFPAPSFRRISSMPEKPLNVTEMQVVCHVGTHVDAPCHFMPDGPSIDQIPLERLHGPGVVWRMDMEPFGVIEAADLESMEPSMRPGDIVLLDGGWAQHFEDNLYNQNYSLSPEAAMWLVEHEAKMVAVDCGTVDVATSQRKPGFNWPVHHILLSHGVLVAEHLTGLRPFAGSRVEAMFFALNIKGADGAPARVIIRRIVD